MGWLPRSLYKVKPLLFLLVAFILIQLSQNPIAICCSIGLMGYSVWILWMRYQWKDTGIVE